MMRGAMPPGRSSWVETSSGTVVARWRPPHWEGPQLASNRTSHKRIAPECTLLELPMGARLESATMPPDIASVRRIGAGPS